MITLRDVAAECGVSTSTVSRALNGSNLIRQDVAESIRKVADSMGYHPNEIARSLKTNRSWMIGVLHDEGINHPFYSGVLESIRNSAEALGYDIVLFSRRLRNNGEDPLDPAMSRRVDGVLVLYADIANDSLNRLMQNEIPIVSVGDCSRSCPTIISDHEGGTYQLADLAIHRGHRRIAFLHGQDGTATRRRIAGFKKALAAHGLSGELIPAAFYDSSLCSDLILHRMDGKDVPSCFLLPDDDTAMEVILRLQQRGLRVPQDAAIAGFDGQPWVCSHFPGLTTYRQDFAGIGSEAVRQLFSSSEDGRFHSRSETLIPGTLLPGETV